MQPNYDLLNSQPVVLPPHSQVHFWIVGCGGTGSFLVQIVARIAESLVRSGKPTKITLVDPDHVEPINITRQCFCEAEVGLNKAQTLAARCSLAWNQLDIEAIPEAFQGHWVGYPHNTLIVLFGCVDRASGRRALVDALAMNHSQHRGASLVWWIDAGNGDRYGQVLIGSSLSTEPDDYLFNELGCLHLPAPSLQAPELLQDKPEELDGSNLSCEQITMLNAQSLTVNAQAATIAADLAIDLATGKLHRYAVYFDQATGVMQSRYTTKQSVLSCFTIKA